MFEVARIHFLSDVFAAVAVVVAEAPYNVFSQRHGGHICVLKQ